MTSPLATAQSVRPTLSDSKHPLTAFEALEIINVYVNNFPVPQTPEQRLALEALDSHKYDRCKVLSACYLDQSFIRAIGYLSSVPGTHAKGMPQLCTLLSEAARAGIDAHEEAAAGGDITKIRAEKTAFFNEMNQTIFDRALATIKKESAAA